MEWPARPRLRRALVPLWVYLSAANFLQTAVDPLEERLLRLRFGAQYERYLVRTGGFLPRLAPPRGRP